MTISVFVDGHFACLVFSLTSFRFVAIFVAMFASPNRFEPVLLAATELNSIDLGKAARASKKKSGSF